MRGYRDREIWAWKGEIGPFLEEARESQGLSLKEAEQSTSIRALYLESLERENPGELPGLGYVQGFLGSYAEFLGLDVEEIGRRFERHGGEGGMRGDERDAATGHAESNVVPRPAEDRSGVRRLRSGALTTVSLAVLTLAVVLAAFYLLRGEALSPGLSVSERAEPIGDASGGSGSGDPAQVGGPAPTLEDSTSAEGAGRGGRLRATVLVRGSESWISVESDSGVEYTGIAQPGFTQRFESGESLRITTGNAGSVMMRLNGMDYGSLGDSGEVTSRSFTLKREL